MAKDGGQADKPAVWAFPTRSQCPSCQSCDTVSRSTRPPKQHRLCRTCGERYAVVGTRLQ